ncbi:MAG TPA: site-specific DNA-methyltransferase [Pyrinomonadaceae bacterium]|jgi:site-specific DNA-methyltransferase (adenine-specific)|nr:site-specific DNA-methyltransferase [Pyrinomonadaceae bacterium]
MSLTHPVDSLVADDFLWEAEMPQSVPSPVFVDEKHGLRLYQGDAMELLRQARSEMFDLIFADPPYFLSNDGITCQAGKMVSVNKGVWDKATTFEEIHKFNLEWLEQCHRLLKPNGTIWVTGTSHNIYSVGFALQTLGYKILNDIAWYKVNPPPNLSCRYFTHATETIIWARRSPKARHTFNYEEMKRENRNKQMQSLWQIPPPKPREKRCGKHPTQKPEALLDRIIRASSNPHDIVLDPFCGSGTTGVVCARHGRSFIGIDLILSYLNIAAARLRDEVGSDQLKLTFSSISIESIWIESKTPDANSTDTWTVIVSTALRELGGEGYLKEINRLVEHSPRTQKNRTWPSTVRRVVRQSRCFEVIGRGHYRLRKESLSG